MRCGAISQEVADSEGELELQTAMIEARGEAGRPALTAVTGPDPQPLLNIENDPTTASDATHHECDERNAPAVPVSLRPG